MKTIQKKKRLRRSDKPCRFCVKEVEPDYKEIDTLKNYLSAKHRIISRMETGLCQKHQKRVAAAIKRARHLAWLPFVGCAR